MTFETKDSGKREEFTSGMVRDVTEGKTNFALVADGPLLERWAALLTRGAVKYEKRNWMKASGEAEYDRFRESAFRHFMQWYRGDNDEDHAAAVVFNINGAEYVDEKLDNPFYEFDSKPIAELISKLPPFIGSIPQGDGDDGGSPFADEAECKAWDIEEGCFCKGCSFKRDYLQGMISSTPVQVLNRSVRPVDNA